MIRVRPFRRTRIVFLVDAPLQSGESLLEVFSEVLHIFNPHAEAHQAVVHASGASDLGGDAGVRHRGRVADQRLHPSKALGEAEQPRAGQEALGRFGTAFQPDADHTSEIAHLAASHRMVGVLR
jgi:hypothetical protein